MPRLMNEQKTIRGLELSIKLGRAVLRNPDQCREPMAKHNIEFLCAELEKAVAQCRYMSGLLDRVG